MIVVNLAGVMISTKLEDIEKHRNPEFPDNYIQPIKENIGKVDYIFVSSHKEVRRCFDY